MALFKWLKKKPDKPPTVNSDPEQKTTEEPVLADQNADLSDGWDEVESVSLSMSKGSVLEETKVSEEDRSPKDKGSGDSTFREDSISNESISKGTPLIDTYKVVSDAIKGGMGSVWKVHHNSWNADLAMKRPQPKFFAEGSERRKENFVHECEAWINLGLHPNIVSCYYVREIGGVPTIFSEWMENGSLKDRIEDETLYEGSEKEVQARLLDIAIQFARGLHYAHESKDHLIHQDVKPDNLLLTMDWEAKVADFGLSKARTQLEAAEVSGYTPAYCSSEQFLGKPLTRRTDIYSWAASVLEMYIGKRPWKRGFEAGRDCDQYFDQARIAVSQPLKELLVKCLAEREEDRPHDFAVIEEELKRIYQEVCGSEYPREEPDAAADTADSLNNRALSYLDLGKTEDAENLWEAALAVTPNHLATLYNQGLYLWREGKIPYEELIRRCAAADAGRDETGLAKRWQEALKREQDDVSPRSIVLGWFDAGYWFHGEKLNDNGKFNQHAHSFASISPDGKRIYGAIANAVGCWDAQTLQEVYFIREEREPSHDFIGKFLMTADGRYLVGQSGYRTLWVAGAATGQTLRYLCRETAPKKPEQPPVRTPGGGRRFSAEDVIKAAQSPIGTEINALCLLPDNRHVCVIFEDQKLRVFNLESGQEERRFSIRNTTRKGRLNQVCVSPDGGTLYYGTYGGTLAAVNLQNGRHCSVVTDEELGACSFLLPTNDGNWIIAGYGKGGLLRFRADTLEHEAMSLSCKIAGPAWLDDAGNRLLTSDPQHIVHLFSLHSRKSERVFFGHTKYLRSLDATQDLSLIVGGGWDKTLQIWDGTVEVRRASWEVSVAKSYVVQKTVQNETEEKENTIKDAIRAHDIPGALELLKKAEEQFDPYRFLPLRRELMKLCRIGKLSEIVEMGHFEVERPRGIQVSPKDYTFATISVGREQQRLKLFSEQGSEQQSFVLQNGTSWYESYHMGTLCFSSTGRFLAAGDMPVLLWDSHQTKPRIIPRENKETVTQMAFTPDEKWLFIQSGNYMLIYDTEDGQQAYRVKLLGDDNGYSGTPSGFCILPSGRKVVTFDLEGDLNVYSFYGGYHQNVLRPVRRIEAVRGDENGNDLVHHAVLSPKGDRMYVCSWQGIDVWNTETWERLERFPQKEINPVMEFLRNNVLVSPDGDYLILSTDRVRLWDLKEKRIIAEVPEILPQAFAVSHDGSALYVADDNSIHVLILKRELDGNF